MIARGRLPLGCFLFGLALWDKAVFAWALVGLLVGAALAYPVSFRKALKQTRSVAQAAGAFVLGALPLITYNVLRSNDTIRSSAHFSIGNLPSKTAQLEYALNGSGLFGFIAGENWAASPDSRSPISAPGRA